MSAFETGNKLRVGPHGEPATKTMITVNSGQLLDLANPDPANITLEDIAHGLSQHVRWAGQGRWLSVAQHSIEVMRRIERHGRDRGLVPSKRLLVAALFHDAHEAYIGDLSGGLKYLLGARLKDIVLHLDKAIEAALGIQLAKGFEEVENAIQEAENDILMPEYDVLFRGATPYSVHLEAPLCPEAAERLFLGVASHLGMQNLAAGDR